MKKVLCCLLAVILSVACLSSITLFADDGPRYVIANKSVTQNEEFTMDVSIADNPGIISLRFKVVYDTEALELKSVQDTGLLNLYTTPDPTITSPYTLRWADSLAKVNNTSNGVVAKLTFKALKVTRKTTVTIEHIQAVNVKLAKPAFSDGSADVAIGCKTHTPGEPVNENVVPATCGQNGSHDEVVYCTVCNTEISRATKTDLATGNHTYAWKSDSESHWQECTVCGDKIGSSSHTGAAAVKENVVPATCGQNGSHDEVVYCSVCGYEISRATKTDLATGIHTPGKPVNENVVPATCGQDGSHDEVVYCTVCNTEISRATKTDLATGEHDFVWMSNAEAHWQQCKNCPAMPEGAESEAHTFEYKVTKEATTKAPGEKVPTCTKCGYEGKAEEIPQLEDLSVEDGDQALDIKENNAVVFKTNIKKDRFSGIKIDGIELEDEDYELGEDENGNTVLTLTDAGKAKLAAKNGDVAVQILGTDEDGNPAAAEYTLTVTNTQPSATDDTNTETGTKTDTEAKTDDTKTAPKTDDSDIAFLVIALVALMGMSVSTGIVYRKKRNNK